MCAVPVMLTEQNRMSSAQVERDHVGVCEVGGVEAHLPVGEDLAVEALHEGVVLQQGEQVGHVVGQEQVVVAQVEDRVAAGGLDRVVAVALAVVGTLREVEEPHPRIGRHQSFHDGPHLVGDAVADQQHLEVLDALPQHRVDGERQGGGLVVDRDEDRGAGHEGLL